MSSRDITLIKSLADEASRAISLMNDRARDVPVVVSSNLYEISRLAKNLDARTGTHDPSSKRSLLDRLLRRK